MALFTISAQAMDIVLPTWLSVWSRAYSGGSSTHPGFFIGIFTGIYAQDAIRQGNPN